MTSEKTSRSRVPQQRSGSSTSSRRFVGDPRMASLIRIVRQRGDIREWGGSRELAIAAKEVFGDSVIQSLEPPGVIDDYAALALTSYTLHGGMDEYPTPDLVFKVVDYPNCAVARFPLPAGFFSRVQEIIKSPGLSRKSYIVAALVLRYVNWDTTSVWKILSDLPDPPQQEPRKLPRLRSPEPAEVVNWVRHAARTMTQSSVVTDARQGGLTLTQASILSEFGFRSLWVSQHADVLAEVVEEAHRQQLRLLDGEALSLAPAEKFTLAQDSFMRSLVRGRLAKVFHPPLGIGALNYNSFDVLMPFASIVAQRASTLETQRVAVKLALISHFMMIKDEKEQWYLSKTIDRQGLRSRFETRLALLAPFFATIGGMVAAASSVGGWLEKMSALIAFIFMVVSASRVRRASGMQALRHPRQRAQVASALLAAAFGSGLLGVGFFLFRSNLTVWEGILLILYLVVLAVTLSIVVELSPTIAVKLGSLLPELDQLPLEVQEQLAEAFGSLRLDRGGVAPPTRRAT